MKRVLCYLTSMFAVALLTMAGPAFAAKPDCGMNTPAPRKRPRASRFRSAPSPRPAASARLS